MSTLDDWITEAGQTLSLPPGPIPAELRNELLDLTRDVAHGVARIAGPLTCYLAGIAVGRGAAPGPTVEALAALARTRIQEQGVEQPGVPTEGIGGETS